MKQFTRFLALCLTLLVFGNHSVSADVVYEERIMGDPNAPVTMIEYASFTCSHCADFHNNVFPDLKKDFIDTGKVKFILRDFPFERIGATAALLSRCVAEPRYKGFVDLLMKQQKKWLQTANPIASLTQFAKLAGMSDGDIQACMENEPLLDKIIAVRKEATDVHGFNSTPSFLVNGEKVVGSGDYDRFKSIIEAKLP